MDTKRYYLSNFIEGDLSILAVKPKEMIQQIENIVEIFKINNEMLYGPSPSKALFLMKENKKSICSLRSSQESSRSDAKSHESISTPIKLNPDTSKRPRRYLPLDDAEKKDHSSTLKFSTPPVVEVVLNPTIDKVGTSDEQFASQVGSEDSEKSPPSAEMAKVTTNLPMDEKESESAAKVVGSIDASSHESPPSSEVYSINASLAITGKESISPTKEVGKIKLGNQECHRSAEITRMTSSLTGDGKESKNLIQDDQMTDNSVAKKDFSNPEENAGKSENPDSTNKYFIMHAEGMKFLDPVLIGSETPSPVKRTKMCSIPTFDTQDFARPSKKDGMGENSLEDTKATDSRVSGAELNKSPNEAITEITRDDRKRKSLSPRNRSTAFFKSIPRVIKLSGEEIDIEVVDLEYGASPTASGSKSADYQSDSPKDSSIKFPVNNESKMDNSPKTPEWYSLPSDRTSSTWSSCTISVSNSPGSEDDVVVLKNQSGKPSLAATATGNQSYKVEYSSADIEANSTLQKFNNLLALRHQAMKNSFFSVLNFQRGINFINSYVHNVLHFILTLDFSRKYSAEEFKKIVRDTNVIALKLINKLQSWEQYVDLDIQTWHKWFQQSEHIKEQYEPLFPNEGIEAVHVYECEMRKIWEKMDDMVTQGDSRRVLFSLIASDVERFIKILVKSLIIVGILQSR